MDADTDDFDLVAAVSRAQLRIAATSLPNWLIEAQLEEIESDLEVAAPELAKRIGEGRFVAIGTIATLSLSIAAGLLVHPTAIGAAVWKLRRLLYFDRDWRASVISLYARLDGLDARVFEAIHWLCLEPLIVNFEQYEAENFSEALGTEAPDLNRVVALINVEASEVARCLNSLTRREIVRTDGSRFWIPF